MIPNTESSEESSLPRLRGRLLQSCRAHCLSSKAQTCCGQPVLPLVFLSLLLTVLFKISFWGDRMRGEREKQKGERREKKVRYIPPLSRSHLLCFEIENYEQTRAHRGLRASRDNGDLAAGEAAARGSSLARCAKIGRAHV